ncbi:recombinase [Clostridia bacterium]|nr:recombinase [Clostridia bacterium]
MKKIYKTAMYLRLSKGDEKDGESGSITNQRDFLMAFINARDDLELTSEYADDGYGGYDFDRPQFLQMLSDVNNKKIDCIVVKDLSRLGRNHLKVEEFAQLKFPKLGVRFIAVGNDMDTGREKTFNEMLASPIINLANEWYVSETSVKIRRSQEIRRKSGDFVGNFAVYGYVKNGKKLEIDEEVKDIIKQIFAYKIEGKSNKSIAEILNKREILCPMEYKLSKGIHTATHLKIHEKALWSSNIVKRILENPVYTGTLIQGKTTTKNYRDKQRFVREKSDWAITENAHEAIISDFIFDLVGDLLGLDTYSKDSNSCYLFSHFLYCGNCGKVLYRRAEKSNIYYVCKNKECENKRNISENTVKIAVEKVLKSHLKSVSKTAEPTENFIDTNNSPDVQKLEQEIAQIRETQETLRAENKRGIISNAEFLELNNFYENKITKAQFQINEVKKSRLKIQKCYKQILEKYNEYVLFENLTRAILVTFVEKIIAQNSKSINIFFRYADLFGGDKSGS